MFLRKIKYLIVSILIWSVTGILAQNQGPSENYRKWLEEEVVYIITPREKSVFLQLNTNRERDLFIEAFWKQRDPIPNTSRNEFREEHYRRVNYANQFLGRGTAKPGWKTDRGRIYIILGEPQDIMRTEGKSEVYPTETWFYQGMTDLGFPPGFHLIFYQRGATGEYRLYSPLQDGPQRLLTTYEGDPRDYVAANETLREIDPQLAALTLSLVTGDQSTYYGRPSMTSDLLIERVESSPVRRIKDLYAQKFLEYKDIIDVAYSSNYIGSAGLVKVTRNAAGIYFVNYAIEPERLSVNQYEDKYYSSLKINGILANAEGKTLYQYEKNYQLEFEQAQIRDFSHRTLNLQDMIPVIPGQIRLSVLLQNEVSKEFTSLESTLVIPGDDPALQMTSLISGFQVRTDQTPEDRQRPFQLGRYQILFSANRSFLQQDDLWLGFQIHGLIPTQRDNGRIQYSLTQDRKEVAAFSRDIKDIPELPNVLEKISLKDFPPAHYRIRVSLLLDDCEVLTESEEFDITYADSLPRPWFYTKSLPAQDDPIYDYAIGTQFYNDGRPEKAREFLGQAFQKNPNSSDIALQLGRTLAALEDFKALEPVLLPLIDHFSSKDSEAYLLMAEAYRKQGRYDAGIDILNRSLLKNGLNIMTLNALGRCYMESGNQAEALKSLEKSLEMEPDQPEIRALIQNMRRKN
jgi:GWxTD domain-containing protein